ncbi:hypothetical protein [Lysobacter silvisoli]|uniref:Uncharacterized protein n=1 Tax=Lysobacter silvisoli TaxID=2293254 RepID=A0A371K5D6_9GAMM|nr:hypothetical protein [Lysobacter silvisoli]RDZ29153.1 hypothetical protein DX914_08690 [Lysobacter silvisoli]
MSANRIDDDAGHTTLDARERSYLRTRLSSTPPILQLADGLIAVAVCIGMVVASPELHGFWSIFGFGVMALIMLLFALHLHGEQTALRADLEQGVKRWREGRIHDRTQTEDSESGAVGYRVYVAIDGDPDTLMDFPIPQDCYEAIAQGDRVRIAYAPKSGLLLDLIDGSYEFAAVSSRA